MDNTKYFKSPHILPNENQMITEAISQIQEGILVEEETGKIVFVSNFWASIVNSLNIDATPYSHVSEFMTHFSKVLRDPVSFQAFCDHPATGTQEAGTFKAWAGQWFLLKRSAISFSDSKRGFLWILSDITASVDSDSELEKMRAHKIKIALEQAKNEIASGIAHEINNPLAIVQSQIGLLEDRAIKGTIDVNMVLEAAAKANKVITRISEIIRGMKAMAQNGEAEPFQKANMMHLIEDALLYCREKFKDHGVELIMEGAPELMDLKCRPVHFSQVLLNLLMNSFDAVASLDQRWVRISIARAHGVIELAVSDSGKGIPESLREKIFVPFFTTKEAGKGTGLGLSLSKKIMESMGGNLRINSSIENTCFIISIPAE